MSLVEHAESELRRAGWFDEDSDYGGEVGPAVLQLVKVFAEQGHSGGSAPLVIHLFRKVALFDILAPLMNPKVTGEYIECDLQAATLQSTRKLSVFSSDGGKTWYDIDRPKPWWKRWMFSREKRFESPKFAA